MSVKVVFLVLDFARNQQNQEKLSGDVCFKYG